MPEKTSHDYILSNDNPTAEGAKGEETMTEDGGCSRRALMVSEAPSDAKFYTDAQA